MIFCLNNSHFRVLMYHFKLFHVTFQQECQQETYDKYGGCAQNNGQITVQMDAWKVPHGS